MKKPPTSQNTLENSLEHISNVGWPTIYMISQKVTIESSLQIFCHKILNNILLLNNRLSKFGQAQSPLCSLCKRENETTKHLFNQCFITKSLWDPIKSWLMGSITLLLLIQTHSNLVTQQVFKFFLSSLFINSRIITLLLTFTNSNYLQC